MHKRWYIYILIGLGFGIVDWYFLDFLASLSQNQALNSAAFQEPGVLQLIVIAMIVGLNYGIWLVPAIPAAVFEMRSSGSVRFAAIAASLVWVAALFSYYTYYAFLLMFSGLPNLEFMLFTNRHSATYWADWWMPFRVIIVEQFIEWVGIGLVGGAIIGALSAYLYRRITARRSKKKILPEGTPA